MANLYEAYDKKLDKQGLGWADQWDYKHNDKYGHEGHNKGTKTSNGEKLAKAKQAVGKTKQAVTSGAQKVKSGTSSGIKWIKGKVQRKPTGPHFDGA